MAQSLSEKCTPLKREYDSCFNSWFEGFLEPAVAASKDPQKQTEHSKRKADEFQEKCGKVWESYKACIQGAMTEKGLDKMLQQARDENPLTEPPTK